MTAAIITGATGALGSSLAINFAKKKIDLILIGRDIKRLNKMKIDLIRKYKIKIFIIKKIDSKKKLNLKKIIKDNNFLQKIDKLVLSSGVYEESSFFKLTLDKLKKVFEINFFYNFTILKSILPLFLKNKGGIIYCINSLAGKNSEKNQIAYSASKFALKAMINSIQFDLLEKNIKLINIFPGAFKSKITRNRKDYKKLINTQDLSDFITKNSYDYNSMRLSEVKILRKNY